MANEFRCSREIFATQKSRSESSKARKDRLFRLFRYFCGKHAAQKTQQAPCPSLSLICFPPHLLRPKTQKYTSAHAFKLDKQPCKSCEKAKSDQGMRQLQRIYSFCFIHAFSEQCRHMPLKLRRKGAVCSRLLLATHRFFLSKIYVFSKNRRFSCPWSIFPATYDDHPRSMGSNEYDAPISVSRCFEFGPLLEKRPPLCTSSAPTPTHLSALQRKQRPTRRENRQSTSPSTLQ